MIRAAACSLLSGALALFLAPHLHDLPAPPEDGESLQPPASVLRIASGGYEAVLSDWLWLRAIQYYGTRTNIWLYYKQLPGYLEAATDLDPDFAYLYQFGGEVLPTEDPVSHSWHNTGAAIRLLEKGMLSHSGRWQIPFLLAYNLYTYRGDYLDAGSYMKQAALRSRAPAYLNSFAPTLLARGGSVETAIDFTQAALDRAQDKWTKADLEERLKALFLQQDLDRLNLAADTRRKHGQSINKLDDLIGYAGLLAVPEEPFGGHFTLAEGRVVSSDDAKIVQVFIHPGSPPTQPYTD